MKKDKTIQAKFTARDEMGNEWLSDVFEDGPKIKVEEDGITYEALHKNMRSLLSVI